MVSITLNANLRSTLIYFLSLPSLLFEWNEICLIVSGRIPCPHPGRIWLEQRGLQRALYWHIEARVVLDLQEISNSVSILCPVVMVWNCVINTNYLLVNPRILLMYISLALILMECCFPYLVYHFYLNMFCCVIHCNVLFFSSWPLIERKIYTCKISHFQQMLLAPLDVRPNQ